MRNQEGWDRFFPIAKPELNKLSFLEDRWEFRLRSMVRGLVRIHVPLKEVSPWPVHGQVDALVYPEDREDLKNILKFAQQNHVPWLVLGSGDHVILRDWDFHGMFLKVDHTLYRMGDFQETGQEVSLEVEAGVPLPEMLEWASDFKFKDIETLYGITGSIGGTLWRNAGNGKRRLKDFVEEITVMLEDGTEVQYSIGDLKFHYGQLHLPRRGIILSAKFRLVKSAKKKQKEDRGLSLLLKGYHFFGQGFNKLI